MCNRSWPFKLDEIKVVAWFCPGRAAPMHPPGRRRHLSAVGTYGAPTNPRLLRPHPEAGRAQKLAAPLWARGLGGQSAPSVPGPSSVFPPGPHAGHEDVLARPAAPVPQQQLPVVSELATHVRATAGVSRGPWARATGWSVSRWLWARVTEPWSSRRCERPPSRQRVAEEGSGFPLDTRFSLGLSFIALLF